MLVVLSPKRANGCCATFVLPCFVCLRPPFASRDKATASALKGHASRLANWTAGANNVGATVFLLGASNAEISDCDMTCSQWCIKADQGNIPWLPMGGDPKIVSEPYPSHHCTQLVLVNAATILLPAGVT